MRYQVDNVSIKLAEKETLVCGSVCVCGAEFVFDASWDVYPSKTAVFRHSNGEQREALITNGRCDIPWEVLQHAGRLYVGVYGENATSTRPTLWADPLRIHLGATACEPSDEPSPSKWQQILAMLDQLVSPTVNVEEIEGGHRVTITDVNGDHVFDVMDGEDGGGSSNPGTAPYIGENGNWYVDGADTGIRAQGEPGYTPVKGVDYYTEADKAEMVTAVLAALPNGDEVNY